MKVAGSRGAADRRWRARGLALALLLALPGGARAEGFVPPGAFAEGAFEAGEPRLEARLLVDGSRSDATLRVGVRFDLDPGWHLYWRNPGESGLPTRLDVRVEGARAGPILWPAPEVFRESEGLVTTFGYSDRVLLASRVTWIGRPPAAARARVDAEVLVCRHACVPAHFSLTREIPDRADSGAAVTAQFEGSARRLPTPPEALGLELVAYLLPQSAAEAGAPRAARLELRGPGLTELATGSEAPVFFPHRGADLTVVAAGRPRTRPGALAVDLAARAGAAEPALPARLDGVLTLAGAGGRPLSLVVDLPLADAAPAAGGPAAPGLAAALGLALLGGLLLNLMPCVLPVLALKVFALTELARRSRREVLAHALAYTAGILSTMLALALLVVSLRAAGASVGWGFQFQEPLFAATLSALLVVFAANLFGVFEISLATSGLARMGADASGAWRSFFEGLLAVLLATPCSAPFLGTAVGLAFASPAPTTVAVFAAIGLGLALPFVVVSAVPAWARWLPRPGAWMQELRVLLGFALLATVVWLVWIAGRSAGVDAAARLLALLLSLGLASWLFGRLQASGRKALVLPAGLAFLLLAGAGVGSVRLEPLPPAAAAKRDAGGWAPYDAAAVQAALAAGQPVFVRFTADWCITCKLNERGVLADERVVRELERLGVARFEADWTRRDEAIRAELARFGRAGVPLYLVYDPEAPHRPALLPELLSVERVVGELRRAAAGGRAGWRGATASAVLP